MQGSCIIEEERSAEIEVKKSRFIATIRPVYTEEEAQAFIASIKKKYWDARHNCHAFIIGDNGQMMRCSDDSEPQGTAGRPMLDVLLGARLINVCVVVTRYFGGTLLGTGGLVRAYSDAVSQALKAGEVLERIDGVSVTIQTDYTDLGKVQYLLADPQVITRDSEYAEDVKIHILLPEDKYSEIENKITEGTAARAKFTDRESVRYARSSERVVML